MWKLSTYPQDPEVKICRVFGAVTPRLIKKAGVHQLWEQGYKAKEDPLWINLIEMEAMTPLPAELSDTLSEALAAKVVYTGTLAEATWVSGLQLRRKVACQCSSSLTSTDGRHMRRASTQSGPWLKQALSLAPWAMYVRGEALAVHRAISDGGWHRCARTKPGHSRYYCRECIVYWWDERDKKQAYEGHGEDYAADRSGLGTVNEGEDEGS